jgi:hypothetical protein
MTTVKDKTTTKTNEFIEQAETHVKDWLDYFDRLEKKMQDAGDDIDQVYHERITDLKGSLNEVEERFEDLKSSDQDDWDKNKYRFQQSSRYYHHSYATLINDMKEDENTSAGWLEGFTNKPPAGSAGWLEGTGASSKGSEGWVEGMAERSPKSEGWKEGYSDN